MRVRKRKCLFGEQNEDKKNPINESIDNEFIFFKIHHLYEYNKVEWVLTVKLFLSDSD